uniref:Sidoreflexin n=1 Tax=Fibrocapsa japonica TaxID=94617 RepID=A0A7S2V1M8_9STRA|mmetsp:Transcript_24362/g.35427  ORF Transcript_24362/g.35427 Transcript_24362/m.35427 type:complete len:325 (+) Transcript_24362:23-997(+)
MACTTFSLSKPKYDQSSYTGRLKGILSMVDPFLLTVPQSQLTKYADVLERYRKTGVKEHSDEYLWEARRCLEAAYHPVTGETIALPFRIAAFIPMNVPICFAMLSARTTPAILFSHWINQTLNSGINYSYRSGADMKTSDILASYTLAIGTSCGMAFGLNKLAASRAPSPSGAPSLAAIAVPYLATVSAGAANLLFTRRKELEEGVTVSDHTGKEVGVSTLAARQCVSQTFFSRVALVPIPILLVPPLIKRALQKVGVFPKSPKAAIVAELGIITSILAIAAPSALALFPSTIELDVNTLENEFHHLVDDKGKKVTKLFANKGL